VRIGLNLAARLAGLRLWPEAQAGAVARRRDRRLSSRTVEGVLDALASNLAAEEERLFPWCIVAFGAGIVCYFGLPSEPSMAFAGAVAMAALASAIAARRSATFGARFLLALIAAAGFGFAAAKLRTNSVAAPAIVRDIGPIEVAGRIASVDIFAPNRARVVLEPIRVGNTGMAPPSRLRFTMMGANAVASAAPGAWVSARAVLRPPPEPAMPHGYDFARWAYFQEIGGIGFTYGAPKPIDAPREDSLLERISVAIEAGRMAMTGRIKEAVPGPDGSIAAALITGERAAIAEEDAAAYRDSGLTHVLSISGLHLALAGLGIFWVVRALLALSPWLALTQPIKKWAAAAAFASASFYLLSRSYGLTTPNKIVPRPR
jgi:competence protein ComEC